MLTLGDIIFICAAPIVCAIIGYATNVIAVKMLFKPKTPKKFLFFRFQGLVPRRQKEIAKSFAEIVSKELVTTEEIQAGFNVAEIQKKLLKTFDDEISNLISSKLMDISPLITAFISPELITRLKKSILGEIEKKLPEHIINLRNEISNSYDIKSIVENKIANFDLIKLEEIILAVSKRELKQIERLGGLIGFIIGLMQSSIYLFSQIF